jgi:hypothetical protein
MGVAPFLLERKASRSPASAAVPVGRVGIVARFAMQIGMDPGTGWALILLSRLVGSRPVALGIPPQAGKGETYLARRRLVSQRVAELLQGHPNKLARCGYGLSAEQKK